MDVKGDSKKTAQDGRTQNEPTKQERKDGQKTNK